MQQQDDARESSIGRLLRSVAPHFCVPRIGGHPAWGYGDYREPGPAERLEHREMTEAAGLEARGERAEGAQLRLPGMTLESDEVGVYVSELYPEPHAPVPRECVWCGSRVCRGKMDGGHSCANRPMSPDVPVRREHELVAIDGIPAATYPFLPTFHRVAPVKLPAGPFSDEPAVDLPERCYVATVSIKQPQGDCTDSCTD